MKIRSNPRVTILSLLTLLAMLISMLPASPVQARPLQAIGAFAFSKGIGGVDNDFGNDIATDANGNIYTTGYFFGTVDFDPGAGTSNLISAGETDVFVSKLDSSGNLLWAKKMGGTSFDRGNSIAVDASGNVYSTGYFFTTADFDPGVGVSDLISKGAYDIFISKLDSNGNFVWAKSMGDASNDQGSSIVIDSNSNVYTTGRFEGIVDFNPSAGTANLTSAGASDVFVSKLDGNGGFFWAKKMGGTGSDGGNGLVVDSTANIYTTGAFGGTADFDPSAGVTNLVSAGQIDIFISKLNSNGDIVWAKGMGGTGNEISTGIAIDSNSNIYSTGYFSSTADFDPGVVTANLNNLGGTDIYISKLDSNGNFVWAKSMGGASNERSYGIDVDLNNNIYTTGYFAGTADFDPGANTSDLTSAGSDDIFISKLDGNGNYIWAKSMGGTDLESGNGIAVSAGGGVYTTGYFYGTADLDPSAGTASFDSLGKGDIFISKLNDAPTFADVPANYWAYNYIERLYSAGVTGGCSAIPLNYCPDSTVTRAQMAVFLLRGKYGSDYTPPVVGASTGFSDVPLDYWAAAWIKQLAAESITSGCGVGTYCPEAVVTRAQMAVFLLKASKFGVVDTPPAAVGVFSDVPTDYWAAAWIEQLAADGVTSGCGGGNYCPDAGVTRAQMAIFLIKTYSLP